MIRIIAQSSGALKLVGGNSYLLAFFLGGSAIFSTANCTMFAHAVYALPRCTLLEVRKWVVSGNAPPSVKVTADTTHLTPGQSTTLRWQASNAATILSSNFGATPLSGKVIVKPATSTYYKLTVSGPAGTTTGGVWVYVGTGPGPAPLPHGMIALGTLGGDWTVAADINDAGQVAGWGTTADGSVHAFLWDPASATMHDMGFSYAMVNAMNDAGQAGGGGSATGEGLWTVPRGTVGGVAERG